MEFIGISQHIKRSQLLYLVVFYYSSVPATENRNPLEVCIRRNYVNVPLGPDHKFLRHFTHDYLGCFDANYIQGAVNIQSARLPTCATNISAANLKLIGIDKLQCMVCLILMHSPTRKILFKITDLFLELCFNNICPGTLEKLCWIKFKSWVLSRSR